MEFSVTAQGPQYAFENRLQLLHIQNIDRVGKALKGLLIGDWLRASLRAYQMGQPPY
jgi:hypothetical protein